MNHLSTVRLTGLFGTGLAPILLTVFLLRLVSVFCFVIEVSLDDGLDFLVDAALEEGLLRLICENDVRSDRGLR